MKKAVAFLLILALIFSLAACVKGDNATETTESSASTTDIETRITENQTNELVSDSVSDLSAVFETENSFLSPTPSVITSVTADFGFRAFKQAVNRQKNALISPVSLLTALAMTANGADGKTLEEMEKAIGIKIETFNKNYSANISDSNGVKFANSMWMKNDKKNLVVKDTFVDCVTKRYGAEVFGKKFDNSTLDEINAWVSKNTDGQINNMLSEIPVNDVIYLINTVLFDADWETPYTADRVIENQTFTAENGITQSVTMLKSTEISCNFFELGKTKGIVKHYTNGYSFAAMLPDSGVSIPQALDSFTALQFIKTVTPMRISPTCATGLYPVYVSLPKFEFKCKFAFSDALSKMGMPTAFSSKDADFSNMGTAYGENIFIGELYHNTCISLTENGTKAGAASSAEMLAKSAKPYMSETLEFNRPFIYVIYKTETGMPLFIGTVRDFSVQ